MYLILSDHSDIHARAVQFAAASMGCAVRLHGSFADRTLSGSSISFDSDLARIEVDGVSPICSVWNRRPARLQPPQGVSDEDRAFVMQQWKDHIHGLTVISANTGTFWINNHHAAVAAENKAHQLFIASKIGFSVPRTLISNDPNRIREFVSGRGNYVFKSFSPFAWVERETGNRRVTVTREISQDQLRDDKSIQLAPGIYQECIPKKRELRVTVIGNRLFTMQVTSSGRSVDWRSAVYDSGTDIRAITLPAGLEVKVHKLVVNLGIVYGCIDLGVDEDGNVHFFEINQGGQFLYVEEKLPELPMLACFTSMFLQARCDYSLSADSKKYSFSSFRGAEEYQDWRADYERAETAEFAHMAYVT